MSDAASQPWSSISFPPPAAAPVEPGVAPADPLEGDLAEDLTGPAHAHGLPLPERIAPGSVSTVPAAPAPEAAAPASAPAQETAPPPETPAPSTPESAAGA